MHSMPQVAEATTFFSKQHFRSPEPRCYYRMFIRAIVLTPCPGIPEMRGLLWKRRDGPLEKLSVALELEVNSETDRTPSPTPYLQNAVGFVFFKDFPHPNPRKEIQFLVHNLC